MTIAELIAELQKFPQDAPVCTQDDYGGGSAPDVFYWTDYDLGGNATDYGYPADNVVIVR